MRTLILALPLVAFAAQAPALSDVQAALVGAWTGTLEYRDYSEPETSTKRVKLPTWLTVEAAGADLHLHFVYDDGPGKTVIGNESVHFDAAATAMLKEGRGLAIVTGTGTENDKPVRTQTTWRIGRNILEILEETAPEGKPLAFRHAYTFVRATPPAK